MVLLLFFMLIITLGLAADGLTTALLGQPSRVPLLVTLVGADVGVVEPAPVLVPPFEPQAASRKARTRVNGTMNKNDCRRIISPLLTGLSLALALRMSETPCMLLCDYGCHDLYEIKTFFWVKKFPLLLHRSIQAVCVASMVISSSASVRKLWASRTWCARPRRRASGALRVSPVSIRRIVVL